MDESIATALGLGDWLAYTRNFKFTDLQQPMAAAPDIPVLLVTLYLALIFYVPTVMEKRKPIKLKTFFAFWNLLLTVFSIIGSYYCVPRLVQVLMQDGGFYKSVCDPSVPKYADGEVGFWVAAFILSKIPELMDTVFLVLQKKDVIFLHWFHHVTVMLYCWHAYLHSVPTGLWFATMNYFVHSIMYLYYFLTAIGARAVVKPIAPLITSLQLVQMVVGMTVTALSFYWSRTAGQCEIDPSNNRLGLAMYTSYFVLFALLFKKLYLTKKPRGAAGKEKSQEQFCNVSAEQFEGLMGNSCASPTTKKHV
jgi:elongation of very long chain fatty acids protein 6